MKKTPTNDKEARVGPQWRRRWRPSPAIGGGALRLGGEHAPVLFHETRVVSLDGYLTNYCGIQSGVRRSAGGARPQPLRGHRFDQRHAVHRFAARGQDLRCRVAAELVSAGHVVFSPIVHGHPLVRFGLPTDWRFWQRHDREHLGRSKLLLVLALDGWQQSIGVQAEIGIARALALPVVYLVETRPATLPTLAFAATEGSL